MLCIGLPPPPPPTTPKPGAFLFDKNPARAPFWMPLWQIKHNKGPSMVAQCARKHNEVPSTVPFQWRKCHAVLYRLPSMLANEFGSKWLIVPCVFLSHTGILLWQQSSCATVILPCQGTNYAHVWQDDVAWFHTVTEWMAGLLTILYLAALWCDDSSNEALTACQCQRFNYWPLD